MSSVLVGWNLDGSVVSTVISLALESYVMLVEIVAVWSAYVESNWAKVCSTRPVFGPDPCCCRGRE